MFLVLHVLKGRDRGVEQVFLAHVGDLLLRKSQSFKGVAAVLRFSYELLHGGLHAVNGCARVLHDKVPLLVSLSGNAEFLRFFVDFVTVGSYVLSRINESLAACYDCRRCCCQSCANSSACDLDTRCEALAKLRTTFGARLLGSFRCDRTKFSGYGLL